jgi:hypothetical protein
MLDHSKQAVIEVLEARFDLVPTPMVTAIQTISDPGILKFLLKKAATTDSLDHFKEIMARLTD